MAHGSNEINVSAPTGAMLFMLDMNKFSINNKEAFIGLFIGLISLVAGFLTLGKRYLHKYRHKFLKTTLSNGVIVNTSTGIVLLLCSFFGFTISCTHMMAASLYVLKKK